MYRHVPQPRVLKRARRREPRREPRAADGYVCMFFSRGPRGSFILAVDLAARYRASAGRGERLVNGAFVFNYVFNLFKVYLIC
jgi:hypothetical protein